MYYCITLILSRHLKHQFTPGQPSMPIPVLIYPSLYELQKRLAKVVSLAYTKNYIPISARYVYYIFCLPYIFSV